MCECVIAIYKYVIWLSVDSEKEEEEEEKESHTYIESFGSNTNDKFFIFFILSFNLVTKTNQTKKSLDFKWNFDGIFSIVKKKR